jgi:DNA topoisomerase-2
MQTKDTLTLRASAFGSKCELPEKFLKKVADAGVLEAVAQFAKYKEDRALKKSDGAKRNRLTGERSPEAAMAEFLQSPLAPPP